MKLAIKIMVGAVVALSVFGTFSCSSNKPIPDDLTAKELIQRGQEAFEKSRNREALRYFNAVVDRYGTDPALYIEARYEIGHLYMKKKNYEEAAPVLQEIIDLYAHYPVGTFPAAYQKLAQLELAKIPEEKLAAINEKNRAKAEKAEQEKQAELEKLMRQAAEETLREQLQQPAATEDDVTAETAEEGAMESENTEAATEGGL